MRALLASGADVNGANQAGQTALMMAALMGRAEIVRLLLDAGADPGRRDSHGFTALEWSRRRGFADITQLLAVATPHALPPQELTQPQPEAEASGERFKAQEFGPATMAVLKTVHANLEAQRQKVEPLQPVTEEPVFNERLTGTNGSDSDEPAQIKPDIHQERLDRRRLFLAGLKKVEEEVRTKIRQHLPTADLVEPEAAQYSIDTGTPVASAIASAEPLEASAEGPESLPAWLSTPEIGTPLEAAGPTTEPLTLAPTAPLSEPEEDSAAAVEEPPAELPVDTQPEFEVEEVEPETVLAAKAVNVEPTMPLINEAPPSLTPPSRAFGTRRLFSVEGPAPPPPAPASSSSVARPILWVLVIATLLGSVLLTYFITNYFMNGGAASSPPTQASAPAPTNSSPPTKAAGPFPVTAGAIAGAETELPDAEYPAKAKSEGTTGVVTVVVRVNREDGVVVSAQALNGDRQLKAAAEKAAKAAKFAPGKLPNESKVVAGTITYNFGSNSVAQPADTSADDSPRLGGALVGTGLSVPNAEYPAQAKSKGLSGAVMVVVRVNRFGDVIAAHPLNGDTQLRVPAVKAAKQAKFSREKLPKESLVTSGTITYNFKADQTPTIATNPPPAQTPQTPVPQTTSSAGGAPVVGGDLAGKELNIPRAEYPASARSKGISGTVTMLVRVNRQGQVVSWRTLNGDPLLRPAALKAAKRATFSKEKLANITTVLGTITYTFKP